ETEAIRSTLKTVVNPDRSKTRRHTSSTRRSMVARPFRSRARSRPRSPGPRRGFAALRWWEPSRSRHPSRRPLDAVELPPGEVRAEPHDVARIVAKVTRHGAQIDVGEPAVAVVFGPLVAAADLTIGAKTYRALSRHLSTGLPIADNEPSTKRRNQCGSTDPRFHSHGICS